MKYRLLSYLLKRYQAKGKKLVSIQIDLEMQFKDDTFRYRMICKRVEFIFNRLNLINTLLNKYDTVQ